MATLASLPGDIIIDIFSMLPVKSISRFRCVCKLWYGLFKNPKFIKMHLHHAIQHHKFSVLLESYTDSSYEIRDGHYTVDFDVTSSSYLMSVQTDIPRDTFVPADHTIELCDGLIGLSTGDPAELRTTIKMICLWNPLTREYKKISIPTLTNNTQYDHLSKYGVCYDWKIDDYKLFRLVVNDNLCCEVWVCRLGSDSWENIGNIPYDICSFYDIQYDVPLKPLNGIIHWLKKNKVIFSFDIVEERTKDIQIPGCYLDDELYSYEDMEVGVLGEELCLSVNPEARCKSNIDLWVMKDYGVTNSWTKIFSLSEDKTGFSLLFPLHYLNKNHEILLRGYGGGKVEEDYKDSLVSYDPKNGRLVALDIPCIPKRFSTTTFVGSLVSLNSGEYVESYKYI